MKSRPSPLSNRRCSASRGFTLVEMMITLAVFMMLMAAMVAVQIYASRIYTLAATKLIATTNGREALNVIRNQIRNCKLVYVGNYSNSVFTVIPNGQQQIGNAIQICYSNVVSAANWTIYYQDPVKNSIYSVSNSVIRDMADYVTNNQCFWAEDFQGNMLTNYLNNPVIRIQMQFVQWEYPIGIIGGVGVNAYDFYYLRTRITRRSKS
jgi:prepilin-type N-terminal cleavage/methylation domain-containing protein